MSSKPLHYKLVLLGDSAVGKSSTVERFVKNEYFDFQQPTIGASFFAQVIELSDGTPIKFEIWDTAGQDRYRTLAPMYYRGAAAAVVVYDISDNDSFLGAKTYVDELQRQGSPDCVIALAGNKLDLEAKREVWASEARAFAQENGCLFFECSAKTGENVSEIFHQLAEKLPKETNAPPVDYVTINAGSRKEGGCCK